jgi:hypothetical protein
MADSQEIKNILDGVIAKVFEKRIAELRKDLHRGVGESLGSRVSELQLDVETGVAELFNSRTEQVRNQISKSVGDLLNAQVGDLRKELEHSVTEAVQARVGETRGQIEHSVGEALNAKVGDLRKEVEANVAGVFERRSGELRKEIERAVNEKSEQRAEELRKEVRRIVNEVADKRAVTMRQEIERTVGETSEKRLGELRKEVEKVVGEVAEHRVAGIRKDVEKVVAETGEQRIEELRKDLLSKATSELEPAMGGKSEDAPVSALLDSAIRGIQESSSQTDILRSLVDGAAHFASRVALFVVKGDSASGWQARGFDDNSGIKKLSVPVNKGLVGKTMEAHGPSIGTAAEFDGSFVEQFGAPKKGNAVVIPLQVRDKVPALLYADAGSRSDGECDNAALQLLTRSSGLWLEILTLRKATASAATAAESAIEGPPPAAEEAPHAAAAAASAAPAHREAPAPAHIDGHGADDEVHKKAKRFAKLLVDEIKLYNQTKVNEGRKHKDLYSRLKEDIEKSRASYDKRYGNTAAAGGNYFTEEVVRVLAENDEAVLGSGFSRS